MKTSPEKSNSVANSKDRQLFQQLANGKYNALMVLHQKFYGPLCRFGSMFEENNLIVEEKVADVFIDLWSKRHQLENIEQPKAYMYIMARNKLLRTAKSERSLDRFHDYSRESTLQQPSYEDELIDQEQNRINQKKIAMVLAKVPQRSRRVFEMSRIEGFKYKEIAELLGISYRTVEQHVANAMKTIKENITNQSNA